MNINTHTAVTEYDMGELIALLLQHGTNHQQLKVSWICQLWLFKRAFKAKVKKLTGVVRSFHTIFYLNDICLV